MPTVPKFLAFAACCAMLAARPALADCTKDSDCKGARICSPEGRCVDPQPCPPCPCEQAPEPATPAPAPPAAPLPAAEAGALIVTMAEASPSTGIEVTCPGGFRQRTPLQDGVARVEGLPAEACTVFFKGPVNARFAPVQGGQSLRCRLQGATAICE